MKITSKLYLLAGLAFCGFMLLGSMVLGQFRQVASQVTGLTSDILPSIITLGNIRSDLQTVRRLVTSEVAAKTPQEAKDTQQKIDELYTSSRNKLELYKRTYLGDDQTDASYIKDVERHFADYTQLEQQLRGLLGTGTEEQISKLRASLAQTGETLTDAINTDITYNRQQAEEASKTANDTANRFQLIVLVSVIVLAVGILTGNIIVVRQIKAPLNNLNTGLTNLSRDFDFTRRISTKGKDEIAQSVQAVNKLLQVLQDALKLIHQSGSRIHHNAEEVAHATTDMRQAASQVSQATSTMSAAVEQMTVSISHVAEQSIQSNHTVTEAKTIAKKGHDIINQTINTIEQTFQTVSLASSRFDELQTQTGRIGNMVGVIRDIADQTNLLALNAEIEAARAGETGRGFAVVADEVRKLAERTTESTREISDIVNTIQQGAQETRHAMQQVVHSVESGIQGAQEATGAMNSILSGTDTIANQTGEISTAVSEQSQASNNIAGQIEQIAQMTEENNASTQITSEAANQLKDEATVLHDTLARFKLG